MIYLSEFLAVIFKCVKLPEGFFSLFLNKMRLLSLSHIKIKAEYSFQVFLFVYDIVHSCGFATLFRLLIISKETKNGRTVCVNLYSPLPK